MKLKALRKSTRLSQTDFWSRLGVCQSVGSRYERGLSGPPPPLAILLKVVYAEHGNRLLTQLRKVK